MGSNCTFMELKFFHSFFFILIACSNCTFMELKYLIANVRRERANVLIVPLWN